MRSRKASLTEALGHPLSDKRLDILRRVGQVGSISEAARGAGVSYKAAWQALETLSNLAGTALVEKAVGGSGGGGARLTGAGRQLLKAPEQLQAARRALIGKLESEQALPAQGLAALSLRTSMRNQLPCTVKGLRKQGAYVRVELELGDGITLHARITRESSELLGLQPGLPALALCKATAVSVSRPAEGRAGFNLLSCIVTRATQRDEEVAVQVAPGLQLVGFAGTAHGFKAGHAALVLIEESAIVIAVHG